MTGATAPDRTPDLDRWITTALADLHHALDRVLDFDAGLRDARLPDLRMSLDHNLDGVLNLDAGLNAIVSSHFSLPTPVIQQDNANNQTELMAFARQIKAMPLRDRLTIRAYLPLRQLDTAQTLAVSCAHALDIIKLLTETDQAVTSDRAGALESALERVDARDRALDGDLDSALVRAHIHIRAFALARDRDLARDLAHDLAHDLTVALARALDLAHDLDRLRDHDLALAFDRALTHAGDHTHARDYAHDLAESIDTLRTATTDFTGADLTHIDLEGLSLQGVQWSTMTRWPPAWEDRIWQASVQIRPGVLEIREVPRIRAEV